MRLVSPLRVALVIAAGAAPAAFVACDLVPLTVPDGSGGNPTGGNGGSGATGMTSSGSSGAAGSTTSSGTAGGSGGAGGSTSGTGAGGAGGRTTSGTGAGGSGGNPTGGNGGSGGAIDGGAGGDASLCGAVVATFPLDPSPHVAICSVVTYSTNPPTSGPHYPSWAAFKVYSNPVLPGFYVHAMEHGAVVVHYNCPEGCDADVAALVDFLAARPADPLCAAPLTNRFIVTPDPLLDVPFAASAWGAHLKAQCFDLPALGAFIDTYYGKAPEDFCFDGIDPTDPASGIPADCGSPMDGGAPVDGGSD